ncbi:MAG TPA: bifunctional diguanylate cyclase/phosphodiesterase [Gaiellaceae bacterium]|nr:bifunctional diguanylate cyclase/phosphodiesterase [Gaiellaceae bacterium]
MQTATDRTQFVADTFLRTVIKPADAARAVHGDRLHRLDQLMRRFVLIDGVLRLSLVGVRNKITYSTDHRLIGSTAGDPRALAQVRNGSILSRVASVPAVSGHGTVKALVSNVPMRLNRSTVGVVAVEQDYAPIAADARGSLLPVAGVLEAALVLLFILLLPALARASRRLRAYVAEIRYQASHDSLTGLSNREALHENLTTSLQQLMSDQSAAVLLIDLDRFKEVNDSLGHDAGDELLRDIARRLVTIAGEAPVSRLGGDEFAIVLSPTTPQEALTFANRLRHGIELPGSIRDIPVSVDASIGVALAPEDGNDVGQLIRRADVAMYLAKQTRAGVTRYDPSADRNDASKLVLMTELRVAVEREELEVHYQPIVTARTGTLTKVEALVRWHHPTKGMIPPDQFLPLAEHTRLVVNLNRFVLRQAIKQCRVWREGGVDLGVTVNMSVLDLLETSFAVDVQHALAQEKFPPPALTIEITESAFVQEPARVRRTLDSLRALGVQVAIDDFGTGYSSLSYLKDLPVDVLKIDQSFVSGLPRSEASTAIVAAAIELSHRLGLSVVAEGVETDDQYDCLDALGCDLIQGYIISRPVPASTLASMMREASQEQSQAA